MTAILRLLMVVVVTVGASVVPAAAVTGSATWYDAPSIHDAAAGPPLRHGHWRGSTVKVCENDAATVVRSCVVVRLTDWCACPHRVIDLDDRAFARLAPLSVGVIPVRVDLVGGIGEPEQATPTGPATDVTP